MANLTCRRCAATVQSAALRCHFCGTLCPTVDWLGLAITAWTLLLILALLVFSLSFL
jgi:RNA polymerase subunit RPABC4/transcription elongation factor Spt4